MVVEDLAWVDFDLGVPLFHYLVQVPCQLCQIPIFSNRFGQTQGIQVNLTKVNNKLVTCEPVSPGCRQPRRHLWQPRIDLHSKLLPGVALCGEAAKIKCACSFGWMTSFSEQLATGDGQNSVACNKTRDGCGMAAAGGLSSHFDLRGKMVFAVGCCHCIGRLVLRFCILIEKHDWIPMPMMSGSNAALPSVCL